MSRRRIRIPRRRADRTEGKELDARQELGISPPCTQPGDLLDGRFELTREIARGGMGIVFLAQEVRLDRPVAMKMILPEAFANASPESRQQLRLRFIDEAQLAAKVNHLHAVTIYERGLLPDGSPYYTMEVVSGETLNDYVAREGSLTFELAAEIMRQVASVLKAAEAVGVVHRDIKSQNVMLSMPDGRPFAKVIDFGVAKRTNDAFNLTRTGQSIGTPETMATQRAPGGHCPSIANLHRYHLASRHYDCPSARV